MNPLDYDEKDDIYTALVTKGAEALRAPAQHRTKKEKKKRGEKKKRKAKELNPPYFQTAPSSSLRVESVTPGVTAR